MHPLLFTAENFTNPNNPDYRPEWWRDSVKHWNETLLWCGNLRDHEFKDLFLKEVAGEHPVDRQTRVDRTDPEPWFKDAVKDKASLFSQFTLAEDAPESVRANEDNIDLQGTSLKQWALGPLKAFFRDGGAIIGADIDTEVRVGDRRPRLVWVPMRDIYWPEYRNYNGVDVWSKVSVRRSVTTVDANGRLQAANQYWVYELDDNRRCVLTVYLEEVRQGIREQQFKVIKEPRIILDASNRPLTRLPFTDCLTVLSSLAMDAESQIFSPLDDLLTLNIRHFNQESRKDTVEAKTAVPKPLVYSNKDDIGSNFYLGSGKVGVYNPEDRVEFLELKGDSLPQLRQSIYDTETKIKARDNRLFAAGVSMTATEANIENQKARVSLPGLIEIIESAFQDAFSIWESFANATPQDPIGGIEIDASVLDSPPNPAEIPAYLGTVNVGVPAEAIVNALKRKGFFTDEDFAGQSLQATALPLDPNEVIQ